MVAQLTASAELAERCLTGLDERQALQAVTLLGRAAGDQMAARVLLERLLPLLERVVAGLPADIGLLTAISDAIPYPSAALAEADLAVTRRILQVMPDGDIALRARWLNWLGITCAQTGRPAEALPATQEAVSTRRELAAAYPDRYRPDLATALRVLALALNGLGRAPEAEVALRESELLDSAQRLTVTSIANRRAGLARRNSPVAGITSLILPPGAVTSPERRRRTAAAATRR